MFALATLLPIPIWLELPPVKRSFEIVTVPDGTFWMKNWRVWAAVLASSVGIPGRANSEGAQFFACVAPQPQLDGKFSAFGRITEGIEDVEKISQASADAAGLIEKPVRIQKIAIEKKREQPFLNATTDELRKTVTLKTTLGNIKIGRLRFSFIQC